jgi:CRISPR-associated protein Cmr5
MRINQIKVEKAVQTLEALASSYPEGFPSEWKGDISSFGASVIQAGLLPSVLFFSEGDYRETSRDNADDNTKQRRATLMKVVFDVISPVGSNQYSSPRPLLQYIRINLSKPDHDTLGEVTEAAIAVKMALRAFRFSKK